jgi:hypothetical protein
LQPLKAPRYRGGSGFAYADRATLLQPNQQGNDTFSGMATITQTGVISPSLDTPCATQGVLTQQ